MKKLLVALLMLPAGAAFADFECQESAVQFILQIANAPYAGSETPIRATDLQLVSKRAEGDGASSYEHFVFKAKDSVVSYKLKLYVEEIGGICPLEAFQVVYPKR